MIIKILFNTIPNSAIIIFSKYIVGKKPPTEWPLNGHITFQNFHLRYSEDTPFVVKNLNISIESMEKVISNSNYI